MVGLRCFTATRSRHFLPIIIVDQIIHAPSALSGVTRFACADDLHADRGQHGRVFMHEDAIPFGGGELLDLTGSGCEFFGVPVAQRRNLAADAAQLDGDFDNPAIIIFPA